VRLIPAGLRAAGVLSIIAVAAACSETLDASAGCPDLCAGQNGLIETITIDPVVLDTTLSSLTGQGTEATLFVANRGDTVDSRAVIRFDSIPDRYAPGVTDTATLPITTVDSARLLFRIDTAGAKLPGPVTIDAYDVNTDAPDSLTSAVAALFTPDRLIASKTYDVSELKDSVFLPIPGAVIISHGAQRLRIGLRARASGSVQFRIFSVESGLPEQLYFRVSADTSIKGIALAPYSKTPEAQTQIASSLSDYTVLVKGPPEAPVSTLTIGGLPARRVYMQFNVPAFISDTAQIVRATLLMTQLPNRSVDPGDTIRLVTLVSLAAKTVSDLTRASQITALGSGDTLKVSPGDSGVKEFEIASVISLWRSQKVDQTPRAIVLISTTEGQAALEARFFSIEAAPELRPRLRISYSTRKSRGLP
jgi:hypothetical protein